MRRVTRAIIQIEHIFWLSMCVSCIAVWRSPPSCNWGKPRPQHIAKHSSHKATRGHACTQTDLYQLRSGVTQKYCVCFFFPIQYSLMADRSTTLLLTFRCQPDFDPFCVSVCVCSHAAWTNSTPSSTMKPAQTSTKSRTWAAWTGWGHSNMQSRETWGGN